MTMTPHDSERLLAECRRLLERPLREREIYDTTAQQRIARLIARTAEERERTR